MDNGTESWLARYLGEGGTHSGRYDQQVARKLPIRKDRQILNKKPTKLIARALFRCLSICRRLIYFLEARRGPHTGIQYIIMLCGIGIGPEF